MPAVIVGEDDWFLRVRDEQIEQGDLFNDLRVFVQSLPPEVMDTPEEAETEPSIVATTELVPVAIVVSQSCDHDLKSGDLQALCCPVYTLDYLLTRGWTANKFGETWNSARKIKEINYHPLAASPVNALPVSLVDFKRPFNVSLPALQALCTPGAARSRLKPPYREQLAQQFGRKIMRIALPVALPDWGAIKPAASA